MMNNTQKINFTQKFIIETIKPKKKKDFNEDSHYHQESGKEKSEQCHEHNRETIQK